MGQDSAAITTYAVPAANRIYDQTQLFFAPAKALDPGQVSSLGLEDALHDSDVVKYRDDPRAGPVRVERDLLIHRDQIFAWQAKDADGFCAGWYRVGDAPSTRNPSERAELVYAAARPFFERSTVSSEKVAALEAALKAPETQRVEVSPDGGEVKRTQITWLGESYVKQDGNTDRFKDGWYDVGAAPFVVPGRPYPTGR